MTNQTATELGLMLLVLLLAGIGAMVWLGVTVEPKPAPYPPTVCEPVMPEDLGR